MGTQRWTSLGAVPFFCSLALIIAAVICGLIAPLLMLGRFIALDPNEGWNAFFSQIASAAGHLYPSAASPITNNYPPLSFYVIGIVGRVTGDNIFAGRVIALISMLVVASNLYYWLRASGSAVRIAFLGAALFLAFAVTYAQAYVAIDDPQWLAHAIMTTGLVVLWRGHESRRAVVAGAILMVAAGFTKHLLIPLPLAVTFWLARRSKSAVISWIVSSGILLAGTCFLARWAYGGGFFESLHTARQYSWHQSTRATATALKCFAPLVGLSLLLFAGPRTERVVFIATYLLLAALIGALASGGAGVEINSFFDLLIAASLGAAAAIDMLSSPLPLSKFVGSPSRLGFELQPVVVVLLGLCTAAYAATKVPGAIGTIKNLDAREKATLNYVSQIKSYGQGRAACEMPGLCYWANSSFTVDFFNYGQKLKTGAMPVASCESVFRGANIALIQMQSVDGRGSELLPEVCNRIIYENYRPIATSDLGVLLVPRGS